MYHKSSILTAVEDVSQIESKFVALMHADHVVFLHTALDVRVWGTQKRLTEHR